MHVENGRSEARSGLAARLPFYYGWVIVAVAFVTMAIGVNARTAFSLLFPPILDEYGWERGVTAGAFSFGFLVSAFMSPTLGWMTDRYGPRPALLLGVGMMSAGLLLAPQISQPWQLYATLGVLLGGGSVCLGYSGQSLYLPNWFLRRRGLAISVAFAGVGVGSIILLPWMQVLIDGEGWRAACWSLGLLLLCVLAPLNLLVRKRPEEMGLQPDGDAAPVAGAPPRASVEVVDEAWAATDWTVARAVRTGRFWCISVGFFTALFVWYAVQVHQTKYLVEIGFDATYAAWALGFVSLVAIPGQVALGHLSDRIGREAVWATACLGFAVCYACLLALEHWPSPLLVGLMVLSQGALGYGMTSVMGAICIEIFQGRHYGRIFGVLMLSAIGGGALGPWLTGWVHDATGSYAIAFAIALALCFVSALAIRLAAPGKVRAVAGRRHRPA